MKTDNRKLFTRSVRLDGIKLHELDVDNVLYGGMIAPVLSVSRSPRRATLFSSNFYFEVVDNDRADSESLVLSEDDFVRRVDGMERDDVHTECVRPMRSLLTTMLKEHGSVYMVFGHCLSDLLSEADLEFQEYVQHWNRSKSKSLATV